MKRFKETILREGKMFLLILLAALLSVATAGNAQAVTYDVCPTCEYTTVQSAVDAVAEGLSETTTIRVAQGTYSGKTTINSSKKIKIEGGWTNDFSNRTNDPTLTVLQHGAFGIVAASAGAGKHIEVTLKSLKLTGAFSSDYSIGGGISGSSTDGGTLILTADHCLITNNSASHGMGIGIGLQSIGSDSRITFAMDSTTVTQNSVTFYSGSGLYIIAYDSGAIDGSISNSVITNNSAMYGGGIAVEASYPGCCPSPFPLPGLVNLSIINTTITNNTAWQYSYYGGGYGGGLNFSGGSGSIITNIVNSIIWGNSATLGGGDIYNGAIDSYSGYGNGTSVVNVSYSDINSVLNDIGGAYNEGANLLNLNPLFVNTSEQNYHLGNNSPMIDAGNLTGGAPSQDFDGNGRPSGKGIDIGAYEVPVCTPVPSGLVSWWGADNNALDMIGTNNGTLMNDATFAAGKVGQAFSFDGVDDYVEVPHNASLSFSPTSPMTVDLWAYRTSSSNGHHLLAKRAGCGLNDINYQLHLDQIGLCFLGTDVVCTTGGLSDLPLNTWTHIAGTFDGSTLRLFINGQMVASNPSATLGPQNSAPLTIGALGSCSSIYPFGGLLDEVSIYNRGLSASEIAVIYNAGSAGKCKGVIQLFTLFLPFITK